MKNITIHQQLYSLKNSKQVIKRKGGKGYYLIPSKAYSDNIASLVAELKLNVNKFKSMIAGQDYPLHISFKIYRKTHGIFDYNNIVQGVCDAMV